MREDNKYKIKNQIWIEADMFYSDAFNALSASAIKTLMRCLQKRKWEKLKGHRRKQIIYTDEGFIFPYREAAFLNIGTTQYWKNIKTLIALGFLDLIHQGGWYQKHEKEKDYSVYKLSDRWRLYGKQDFIKVEKPKALPDNFHIKENIKRQKLKVTSQKRSEHLHMSEDERLKQSTIRLHKSEVEEQAMEIRQNLTATV